MLVRCDYCGKYFNKAEGKIRNTHNFCNTSCWGSWANEKRVRKSRENIRSSRMNIEDYLSALLGSLSGSTWDTEEGYKPRSRGSKHDYMPLLNNMIDIMYTFLNHEMKGQRDKYDEQIEEFINLFGQGFSHFESSPDVDLNPYKILGVEPTATREQVDKAYREKAKVVHPDKGGTDSDMMKVNAAYETIKRFRGWK